MARGRWRMSLMRIFCEFIISVEEYCVGVLVTP